jgi:hypothetical protein
MTHTPRAALEDLLEEEARAWRKLSRAEYDRAICALVERHASESESLRSPDVLFAIASATLRRSDETLTESRAVCADRLLTVACASENVDEHSRACVLFLLAWLRLLSSAAGGPEKIHMVPPLPEGVDIFYGGDIEAISDPILRAQARVMSEHHLIEIDRWNAKQHALSHLGLLAVLLRIRSRHRDDNATWEELCTAAALAVELTLDGLDRKFILDKLNDDLTSD